MTIKKNYSQIFNFEKDRFVRQFKREKGRKKKKNGEKKFKALNKHLSFVVVVEIPAGLQRDATKRSEIITQ